MELPPPAWSKLHGQVVLVTSASSDIGVDLCHDLARASCRVVATAHCIDRLHSLYDEMDAASSSSSRTRTVAFELYVAIESSAMDVKVQRTWDAFGHVDALVNNAGIQGGVHSSLDWPKKEWDKLMKTNFTTLWLVAKHVCTHMRDAKLRGSGIDISFVAGLNCGHFPGAIGYVASKSAVHFITKMMALELGVYNIRVNSIALGMFNSKINVSLLRKKVVQLCGFKDS